MADIILMMDGELRWGMRGTVGTVRREAVSKLAHQMSGGSEKDQYIRAQRAQLREAMTLLVDLISMIDSPAVDERDQNAQKALVKHARRFTLATRT